MNSLLQHTGEHGRIYYLKKDVLIISYNEPLLFVQGPPVFIRVAVKDEESTSVFVLTGEELEDANETKQMELAEKVEPSSISRRITYLGLPFHRQVYQPLQFILNDETLTGTIEEVDGDTVLIDQGEDQFIAIDVTQIEEILWRGKPFVEN